MMSRYHVEMSCLLAGQSQAPEAKKFIAVVTTARVKVVLYRM